MKPATSKRPFLFVHSSGPTHVHHRNKSLETKIRKHVMIDIGKARRKPQRNPRFETILHLPDTSTQGHVDFEGTDSTTAKGDQHSTMSPNDCAVIALVPPFGDQHPLAVLEKQCGMDRFSAYGITLMLAENRKPPGNGTHTYSRPSIPITI